MDYNYQRRGTNSKTHSRSGFQHPGWLIQVLIEMDIILVKWTAILSTMARINVYWAEGKHARKGGRVQVCISANTFKHLEDLGFESRRGDVCLVAMNDNEHIRVNHIVTVDFIDAPEEECIEIHDSYALEA